MTTVFSIFSTYEPCYVSPSIEEGDKNSTACIRAYLRYLNGIRRIKKIPFWYLSSRAKKKITEYQKKYDSFHRAANAWMSGTVKMIQQVNIQKEAWRSFQNENK